MKDHRTAYRYQQKKEKVNFVKKYAYEKKLERINWNISVNDIDFMNMIGYLKIQFIKFLINPITYKNDKEYIFLVRSGCLVNIVQPRDFMYYDHLEKINGKKLLRKNKIKKLL